MWTAKACGTFEGPWQIRLTPLIGCQSGQPFGRTFQTQLPNYGSVRVLAEPVGALAIVANRGGQVARNQRRAALVCAGDVSRRARSLSTPVRTASNWGDYGRTRDACVEVACAPRARPSDQTVVSERFNYVHEWIEKSARSNGIRTR